MSTAIDLGTISASVALDLSKLQSGRALVSAELASIGKAMDRLATQAEADGRRVAAAAFSREQQKALKAQENALNAAAVRAEAMRARTLGAFTGIAAGITLAGIAAVKMSADFQSSMTKIGNNTTMTTADIAKMKATVIALGKESGASFDDLGEGFMHIANFGFKASESTIILREAMKSAVATGSKTADTADILAKTLHEFGMKASEAGKAMNVMHLAAAQGNMTLQQFDQAAGPAFAQAANLGVGLTEVSAAMSALTRHGLDASEAATQVKDILVHMINPSKSAREELERLSEKTGINLVADFSQAGLKAKGLTGVLDDLRRATGGNGQEIYKLIQAQRGGLGAMILAGTGAKDYKEILASLGDAMSGKVDPATQGYQKSLKNLNTEIARVANEIRADFLPVGEKLTPLFEAAIPVIRGTASALGHVADAFNALPQPVQETILLVGALKLGSLGLNMALGTLGSSLPGLISGFGKLGGAAGAVTTAEGAAAAEGISAFAVGGAWALGIGAAIALVWSLKGAWDHVSGAEAQALHDKAWQEINAGKAATPLPLGAQVSANRSEADRIEHSNEYTSAAALQANAKMRLHVLHNTKNRTGNNFGENYQSYPAALKSAQQDYDASTAALTAMKRDAHNLRSDANKMGGSNALTDAMAKHVGEATGVQCGQAVTNALQSAGLTGSATQLAKAAIANPALQMRPDRQGQFPPGTILYFPDKKHPHSVSGSDQQHFAMAGPLNASGQQFMLESTTAGGHGRHYRNNRTFGEIENEHGGNYYAFAPGTKPLPASKNAGGGYKVPIDPDTLTDLQKRLYEATHTDFQNRKHEALETYQADKKTDPIKARRLYLATLKSINADERAEQKKHYAELLSQWKQYLAAKVQAEKADRDRRQGQVAALAKRKTDTSDLSADMTGNAAALTEDPETVQFAKERAEAAKRLRERQDKINSLATLGPYGKNEINPDTLRSQAQAENDATLKDIQAREDAKAARDTERSQEKAQREKEKADRVIEEADRVAEKQRLDVEDTAKFEYEQGMISLAQYQAFLRAKLAAAQQWQDASHTILTKEWMQAKEAYDASLGEKKQKPGADPFSSVGDGMKIGFGKGMEDVLGGGKGKLHSLTAAVKEWEKETIKSILHVAAMWATSSLFGSKFGGGFNFGGIQKPKTDAISAAASLLPALTARGGKVPSVQFGGGAKPHGLSSLGNLLLTPEIGALGQIHGINGPVGGRGGGLMDIASLAASFLPGGGLLGKLFGGILGKGGGLFGGLKKLFHFASGGVVPGTGFHDTVPAMLTPGEVVMNRQQQAAAMQGSGPHIVLNHYGDNHNAGDVEGMHSQWAWGVSQSLATAVAGR